MTESRWFAVAIFVLTFNHSLWDFLVNEFAVKPMKLGKLPPKFDKRTLLLSEYITPALPASPASADYYQAVQQWPIMGNDKYGDCTCAAAGHMIQEWTANTGSAVVLSDNDILAAYQNFVGNSTDAGVSMLDLLIYWRGIGIGGDTIAAFAQLELQNNIQAQDSIYLFGNCYIGVSLPNFAYGPGINCLTVPWVVPPQGPVGDASPNPKNGHCIPAVGYDQRNLYVVSWGELKAMSWQFYNAYADEAYAVLSNDWINKTLGTAPPGLDFAALQNDLQAITT